MTPNSSRNDPKASGILNIWLSNDQKLASKVNGKNDLSIARNPTLNDLPLIVN